MILSCLGLMITAFVDYELDIYAESSYHPHPLVNIKFPGPSFFWENVRNSESISLLVILSEKMKSKPC